MAPRGCKFGCIVVASEQTLLFRGEGHKPERRVRDIPGRLERTRHLNDGGGAGGVVIGPRRPKDVPGLRIIVTADDDLLVRLGGAGDGGNHIHLPLHTKLEAVEDDVRDARRKEPVSDPSGDRKTVRLPSVARTEGLQPSHISRKRGIGRSLDDGHHGITRGQDPERRARNAVGAVIAGIRHADQSLRGSNVGDRPGEPPLRGRDGRRDRRPCGPAVRREFDADGGHVERLPPDRVGHASEERSIIRRREESDARQRIDHVHPDHRIRQGLPREHRQVHRIARRTERDPAWSLPVRVAHLLPPQAVGDPVLLHVVLIPGVGSVCGRDGRVHIGRNLSRPGAHPDPSIPRMPGEGFDGHAVQHGILHGVGSGGAGRALVDVDLSVGIAGIDDVPPVLRNGQTPGETGIPTRDGSGLREGRSVEHIDRAGGIGYVGDEHVPQRICRCSGDRCAISELLMRGKPPACAVVDTDEVIN